MPQPGKSAEGCTATQTATGGTTSPSTITGSDPLRIFRDGGHETEDTGGVWLEMSGSGCRAFESLSDGDYDRLFKTVIDNPEDMNIGLGSTMSYSQKGREKHVRALTGNNPAQIASYKRGRAEGQKRKQDYLGKQRAARSGKKK